MKALHAIAIVLLISASILHSANAQTMRIKMTQKPTYIMPDGSVLPNEKFDSVSKAWGEGNMNFVKKSADDEKGVIYLVRATEEMKEAERKRQLEAKLAYDAMTGKPAPDFELKDLQGNTWSLKALRGKVVVLNFWFTTCAPCVAEMPELNELVKAYDKKDVVFLSLTFNDAARVNRFLQEHTFNYTHLPASGEVDKKYNVHSWPLSIVIDKEGTVKKLVNSTPAIKETLAAAIDAAR